MRNISDYKVIKTKDTLSNSNSILAQVNFTTKEIHIKVMSRTKLKVLVSRVLFKEVDFKTINKVEEFLLYHEIRHIDNRETLRYTSFKNKIDEEIDCNLFSLNELQKLSKLAWLLWKIIV